MIKKQAGIIFLFLCIFITSCTDKQTKKEMLFHSQSKAMHDYVAAVQAEKELSLKNYISEMSVEQKIAQLFIENLEGCTSFRSYETVGDMTGKNDKTPLIAGGYIFFSYNIAPDRAQMKAYIQSIRQYCRDNNSIQPYLCVDQEGGWVNRLKKLNPPLACNQEVAQKNSIAQAYRLYREQAAAMKELGFDMNLAPVVEVCTQDNAEFLDGRSFGSARAVIDYGTACVNAYENNGIATVLKHFPGNTNTDPHTGLPEIKLSKDELMDSLAPFKRIIDRNPSAILMSHARTAAIDAASPACLSSQWITQILRQDFGYTGLIFSDDIFMAALAQNGYPPEKASVQAVEAGIDCIMISEKRFARAGGMLYKKTLEDSEFAQKIDTAVYRILKYKIKAGLLDEAEIR